MPGCCARQQDIQLRSVQFSQNNAKIPEEVSKTATCVAVLQAGHKETRQDGLPTLMENDATKYIPSFWHNKCCVAVGVRLQS